LRACNFGDSLKVASASVVKFHDDFNSQRFGEKNVSLEYQQAATLEVNRDFLTSVHKKLGDAGEWRLAGWRVNVTPSGTIVDMQCKTKFARGDADESFVWRVKRKSASLLIYHVNSPLLVMDR
jgi:hypothetical protein